MSDAGEHEKSIGGTRKKASDITKNDLRHHEELAEGLLILLLPHHEDLPQSLCSLTHSHAWENWKVFDESIQR